MRNIIVSEFVTLDGVMEDPGGAEKKKHGGWSFQFWNEEAQNYKYDELFASGALLLGRVTYQGFEAAWPSMTDEDGFADRMNSLPKYVVTSTLDKLEWSNSRLISGDVIEEISKLKQQPGQDIVIHGSGDLVNSLMQTNLIDEFRLMVFPIILGGGKRLFQDKNDMNHLKLLITKTFRSGVVVLHYKLVKNEK